MRQGKKRKKDPAFAPGNAEALEARATKEEIKRGDYTRVTTLSFDEVEPSKEPD